MSRKANNLKKRLRVEQEQAAKRARGAITQAEEIRRLHAKVDSLVACIHGVDVGARYGVDGQRVAAITEVSWCELERARSLGHHEQLAGMIGDRTARFFLEFMIRNGRAVSVKPTGRPW